MKTSVRKYLARIGRRGGQRSRRTLTTEQARAMVRVREARRAFRTYYTRCFWYCRPDVAIGRDDIPWVAEQLMKYGDRKAWEIGRRLCP